MISLSFCSEIDNLIETRAAKPRPFSFPAWPFYVSILFLWSLWEGWGVSVHSS